MFEFVVLVLVGKYKWRVKSTRVLLYTKARTVGGLLFGLPFIF
jgi:hypothetical protein